jgi:hypothetical protein
MKLSDVKFIQKNLYMEKIISIMIREIIEDVRIILLSKKLKIV